MKYTFETEYNLHSLTAMAKALRKTVRKKRGRISHIRGWVIVAFSLALLVTASQNPLETREKITVAVGAIILITLIFEDRLNGYIGKKRMLKGTEKAVAVFDEENAETFISETEAGKTEFYYKNIVAIAETKEYFVFILSANHGQLYDKAHLSGGTPEQFRDFISEKTGKSVIYIK